MCRNVPREGVRKREWQVKGDRELEREKESYLKLQFSLLLKHSSNARVVASVHSVYT